MAPHEAVMSPMNDADDINPAHAADSARNRSVDALRVLAASGIVIAHSVGFYASGSLATSMFILSTLARSAVPFFFFIGGWAYARSLRAHGKPALKRRVLRLGVPLAVWWVVSVLALSGLLGVVLEPTRSKAAAALLYAWPAYSLWFFPVAIMLTFVTHVVLSHNILKPALAASWLLFAISVAIATTGPAWYVALVDRFLPMEPVMALYKSLFFWTGATLTGALAATWQPRRQTLSMRACSLVCIACPILIIALYSVPGLFWQGAATGFNLTVLYTALGVSLGILGVARALPRWLDRLAPLSTSSLGVYAVHPLVIDAVVRSCGPDGLTASIPVYIFIPVVLGVTWVLSVLGSRLPTVGKWLF